MKISSDAPPMPKDWTGRGLPPAKEVLAAVDRFQGPVLVLIASDPEGDDVRASRLLEHLGPILEASIRKGRVEIRYSAELPADVSLRIVNARPSPPPPPRPTREPKRGPKLTKGRAVRLYGRAADEKAS